MNADDDAPYDMFFGGIADCGYTGRISFEGIIDNAEEELPRSLATMKAFAEKYGI